MQMLVGAVTSRHGSPVVLGRKVQRGVAIGVHGVGAVSAGRLHGVVSQCIGQEKHVNFDVGAPLTAAT
jgi:hypothetical protein